MAPFIDFDPFAALGITPAAPFDAKMLTAAMRRSQLHRHEATIIRYPAIANAFPSSSQVNQAYQALSFIGVYIDSRDHWQRHHANIFFPLLPVGSAGVFATPTERNAFIRGLAPLPPPPISNPSQGRDARNASGFTPRRANAGPARPSATPRSATTSSGQPGSAEHPVSLSSSDDDDDDDDDEPSPSFRPPRPGGFAARFAANQEAFRNRNRNRRPSAPAPASPPRRTRSSSPILPEDDFAKTLPPRNIFRQREPRPYGAAAVTPTPAAAPPRFPPRSTPTRSGGSSRRGQTIANPVIGERIVVGTATGRSNLVVASFNAAGQLSFRIVNRNMEGNHVAAPTGTAIALPNIVLRPAFRQYANDIDGLRAALDAETRLPAALRQ
jgi:hypothetical protein